MAGFGVLWFSLGYRVLEYVLLYWLDMFPGPVISFALGFYLRALQSGSFVDYGTRDMHVFCWGKKQYFFARV